MKRILALTLTVIMSCLLLASCGNPVYDDLENFINVEMTEVNENNEKIRVETGSWSELEDTSDIETSITDTLLPLVEDSLEKLEKITPETDEVKDLKDTYVKAMEQYQEGFNVILEGVQEIDTEKMEAGKDNISAALEYIEEYNTDIKALAKEVGAKVEF